MALDAPPLGGAHEIVYVDPAGEDDLLVTGRFLAMRGEDVVLSPGDIAVDVDDRVG